MLARATELGDPVDEDAHVDVLNRAVRAEPLSELAEVGGVGALGRAGEAGGVQEALGCCIERHDLPSSA